MRSPDLSAGERRFEQARRRAGLWLGPLLFVAVLAWPSGLPEPAHRLAAVLALAVTFWVCEAVPLPVTALLAPALAVLLGVARARDVFAPFADPVIFLFLGSFLLAEALGVHGLDRRIAVAILSIPGAAASPLRVRLTVGMATAALSMWISNTATAAMMLPIALGLVGALERASVREPPRALLLMVGLAASIGGIATPVGTPPNLITLGFLERIAGRRIDFLTFMALGVPLALLLMGAAASIVRVAVPASSGSADLRHVVEAERRSLPAWGSGQRGCAAAFAMAVTLWLLPGVVAVTKAPADSLFGRVASSLDESVVALLAATMLFFWPAGERRVLTWDDATRIDWGTLLLFGGGLSLGKLMFDTGLAAAVGHAVVRATGVTSLWGLTALALAVAIALTELVSNTAAVNMLAPLVLALAKDLGVSPVPPLLGVGFGASMAFMLPISTPPNAIVYGTGAVPLPFMMKVGVMLDLVSFFVILGTLRLLCPALGLL